MRFRQSTRLIGAALVAAAALVAGPVGVATAAPEDAPTCKAHVDAFDTVVRDIETHNAKPHLFDPSQQAEFNAYNAAAAALNARLASIRTKRLACEVAVKSLGGAPAAMPAGFPALISAVKPTGGTVSTTAAATFTVGLADLVTADTWGEQNLQGKKRPAVGDNDPAFDGAVITGYSDGSPAVSAEAVLPIADVLALPKFFDLTPENQWAILMARKNHRWISNQALLARVSASVAAINGLDQDWLRNQDQQAKTAREALTSGIDLLAQSQDLPR